ncbi:MAG: hypothetical protein ABIW82_09030 [Dokdonella sp.]
MNDEVPTAEDLLINEKLMGGCNHPDYRVRTERDRYYQGVWTLHVCTRCGAEFSYSLPFGETATPKPDYLQKYVPRHTGDLVRARIVLRRLEQAGWVPFFKRRDGSVSVSLERDGRRFEGAESSAEQLALGSVFVKMAEAVK